jgi:hypothetical protein
MRRLRSATVLAAEPALIAGGFVTGMGHAAEGGAATREKPATAALLLRAGAGR